GMSYFFSSRRRHTRLQGDWFRRVLFRSWFNRNVVGVFKQHHAFDAEGIFIGDATHLFVPDNSHYEGSALLLFDEHNHPVNSAQVTPEQRMRCVWRRCYKLVSLLHTNRAGDFFLYGGLRVIGGAEHEAPVLYDLVDEFVRYHGRGVIKRLILDRGFLDGAKIGRCKKDLSMDVLIPVRKDMDIYHDVVGMAEGRLLSFEVVLAPESAVRGVPLHRPERIRKREEARQRTLAKKKA